uniref:Uncharacterized protein n=1 Tax=Cyphia banksiana TaxID=2041113 RepID=A0A291F2Y6_9ASTR|nr:hypothetical protein Cyp_ban1Pt0835 [Cyphia banksiana]YP_009436293.1 hypothetical protein Cyp_ban1Pt1694 [Cyphia banksiana]ATG26439.1 hypothetical protein Cyp_ban1Pt0835 [Cyphia banksiana]ATG26472.1 hypothetical protein Cyp_ban1Pt1694 [Cyphia banksiana]
MPNADEYLDSNEYIGKLFFYEDKLLEYKHKLLQNDFKEKLLLDELLYERKLLEKAKQSLLHKSICAVLSYSAFKKKFLLENEYQEVDKRKLLEEQYQYEKQSFEIKEELSFIDELLRKNEKEEESLLYERKLLENALQESLLLLFVYADNCRENALEIDFMEWLKQTERKIRKIMYTAMEHYDRYSNGGAWDKK